MKLIHTASIERSGKNGYASYRIPGITATASGALIACYEARSSNSDWSVIDLYAKRSTDGGRTWQPRQLLFSGQGKNTTNNPVMIADGDRIHLLFLENYKRLFHSVSTDDGLSWSEPAEITDALDSCRDEWPWTCAATGPGHGLRLSTGRLIVPMWLASNPSSITAHGPSKIATLYSDDRGKSWQLSEVFEPSGSRSPNETCLAELSDGRVLLNIRSVKPEGSDITTPHFRYMAVSKDGAGSWETWRETQLSDPACAAGMCSTPKGILFTHCSSHIARYDLTLRLSEDDGKTWTDSLMYHPYGGYSDCIFNPATSTAFVIYESRHETEILISEIEI
ncbi:MAG: exo-alpha-sialidase [Clostridia bacterium]|nr:exo-alpha-sialidase [Clostridia bacterium]